jgi:hypothetical protein
LVLKQVAGIQITRTFLMQPTPGSHGAAAVVMGLTLVPFTSLVAQAKPTTASAFVRFFPRSNAHGLALLNQHCLADEFVKFQLVETMKSNNAQPPLCIVAGQNNNILGSLLEV